MLLLFNHSIELIVNQQSAVCVLFNEKREKRGDKLLPDNRDNFLKNIIFIVSKHS